MNNESSNKNVYDVAIRLAFLAFIIAWCLMILYPFVNIILWSLILWMAFSPLHRSMVKLMRGKPRVASVIILLACLAIIIVPSWFFLDSIIREFR
jgi:predicted PurR-regulated permease PerM